MTILFEPQDEPDEPGLPSIHSTMAAADLAPVAEDDFAIEKSIGILNPATKKVMRFDAVAGPSELHQILNTDDSMQFDVLDEFLARSSDFWYGEERDDDDDDEGGRRLKGKKSHFKSQMSLLKYNVDGKQFVAGNIATADEIIDISIFPNGTQAFEITKRDAYPDDDDHDPPNMVENALDIQWEQAGGEDRRLRSLQSKQSQEPKINKSAKAMDDGIEPTGLARGLSIAHNVQIDVLVMYTRRAMCQQAYLPNNCEYNDLNRAPIEARISLAIDESNTAYVLSDVYVNLNLVHQELAPDYDDNESYGLILSDFKSNNDDKLDKVHELRQQYNADLAVLVVENAQYCGLGYMFNGNEEYGFSVTSRKCMTGYYSFVHELSHNMGCNHNREVSSRKFPYSHAFLDPNEQFRTIMAYNCKRGCPRINRFSNPNVEFSGTTIGTDGENNARQINEVAQIVADWFIADPRLVGIGQVVETNPPTVSPTKQIARTGVITNANPNCTKMEDAFGIQQIYITDPSNKQNNWYADLPNDEKFAADNIDDERLKFKTFGEVNVDSGEFLFTGPTTMSISKAEDQPGFENTEITAYVKWTEQGTYAYESKATISAKVDAAPDSTTGCNAQAYTASINRKNGEIQFEKVYYKKSFKQVTSSEKTIIPEELQNGLALDEYIGLKFVVYSEGALSVKLEFYIDQTKGHEGGDWQLVHEFLDEPDSWAAHRGWHYSYFKKSECANDDGEPILGRRRNIWIALDGSHDTQTSLKHVSVRNISANHKVQADAGCFKETPEPTKSPTRAPTDGPTATPTIATKSPVQSEFNPKPRESGSGSAPSLNISFSSATSSPVKSEEEGTAPTSNINISFSSATDSEEACDSFGLRNIYKSDESMSENDWTGDFSGDTEILTQYFPSHPTDRRIHLAHNGEIVIGDDKAIFDHQARLYIKKDASSDGYQSIEFTGYGYYAKDGRVYPESGLTMMAMTNYEQFDPCQSATYSATISRETGEASFNKIYWAQTWRIVKGTPITAQIEEFRGELPLKTWIGMKFIVNVLSDEEVKLELYIDLEKGTDGGNWQLVLEMTDTQDAWSAQRSNIFPYYERSSCSIDNGKPIVGPEPYNALKVYGNRETEVHWKNVSIRNISSDPVENGQTCSHQWHD